MPADVRLVLVGNIGCGKTSTGDNILGEQSPLVPGGTRSCQQRQGVCEGKNVTLVEAPRWFWVGGKMEESVKEETERAMTLVEPGLHAVLLLIPVNQFTEVGGTRHFPLHSNTNAIPMQEFFLCFWMMEMLQFTFKLILLKWKVPSTVVPDVPRWRVGFQQR